MINGRAGHPSGTRLGRLSTVGLYDFPGCGHIEHMGRAVILLFVSSNIAAADAPLIGAVVVVGEPGTGLIAAATDAAGSRVQWRLESVIAAEPERRTPVDVSDVSNALADYHDGAPAAECVAVATREQFNIDSLIAVGQLAAATVVSLALAECTFGLDDIGRARGILRHAVLAGLDVTPSSPTPEWERLIADVQAEVSSRAFSRVTLRSPVRRARFEIDGREARCRANPCMARLRNGSHVVTTDAPGYASRSRRVIVSEARDFIFELDEDPSAAREEFRTVLRHPEQDGLAAHVAAIAFEAQLTVIVRQLDGAVRGTLYDREQGRTYRLQLAHPGTTMTMLRSLVGEWKGRRFPRSRAAIVGATTTAVVAIGAIAAGLTVFLRANAQQDIVFGEE